MIIKLNYLLLLLCVIIKYIYVLLLCIITFIIIVNYYYYYYYLHVGRIRKGPAPLNLEIPPYKLADSKLIVG
jgi:hypothetical protein